MSPVVPATPLDSVGAELYDANSALAFDDLANDWAFAILCQAIGLMWQPIADLSEDRDGRPGWAVLVDVETTPDNALPWLAQIPGVQLTRGITAPEQREEVRLRSGQARCRPASMIAAVQKTLTGTKNVRILERTSSAWTLTVFTRTDETPDPDATLAAAMSQKVGGDVLTLIVGDSPLIDEGTEIIDNVTATIDAATLADVT